MAGVPKKETAPKVDLVWPNAFEIRELSQLVRVTFAIALVKPIIAWKELTKRSLGKGHLPSHRRHLREGTCSISFSS